MYYIFKFYLKTRMLAPLKVGKYWVSIGGKEETSTRGRLLQRPLFVPKTVLSLFHRILIH